MNQNAERAVLIYDGDCGFCRAWVAYWKSLTGDRITYTPYQEPSDPFRGISRQESAAAVQLLLPTGERFRGAGAVFHLLGVGSQNQFWIRLYNWLPGFAAVAELVYTFIARHRSLAFYVTKILWGLPLRKETFNIAEWLFLRLLGLIYLIAFLSFGTQAAGLIGAHGISPAADFLHRAKLFLGIGALWQLPTLLWLGASDLGIKSVWLAGALCSAAQLAGLNWRFLRMAAFVCYLSLVTAGQEFMGYQWDALLLEAGFLAIFLGWSPLIVKLYRWLLFRLMFLSGAVKLLSHDTSWRTLSALPIHYETQPLPTPLAWYFFQLPTWFQRFSVGFVFFVELFIPFLILAPRRLRYVAAIAITLLQVLIAVTGNYAFFNLLTVTLCLFLLDDACLRDIVPGQVRQRLSGRFPALNPSLSASITCIVLYILVLFLSGFELVGTFSRHRWGPAETVIEKLAPFEIVNTYGLFAVMTTTRPEIIVEGSNDGIAWLPYEFKYKPGSLAQRPPWVAPHQPRLDWQMWFAALSDYHNEPWILHFLERLLEGAPEVVQLIKTNPFPNAPPHYLRALVYEYRFATSADKQNTGNWWSRQLKGEYVPAISLAH